MAKGEVRYRLVLDSKDFVNGIKAAKNEANAMANDMAGKLGKAGSVLSAMGPAGLAAAAGVGALATAAGAALKVTIDAVSAAAKYADAMSALETKTGLSKKALQDLEVAAKLGNSSLDAVASAVNKMQKGIVDGSENFKKLGLSLTDLRRMSPEGQFQAVAKAIEGISDPAQKAAARMAVFGKSGNDLAGVLTAAAEGATTLGGALSDEALNAAADLADKTDLLHTAWDRVVMQFGAAVAQSPELQRGLDDITDALVAMADTIAKLTPQIVALFDKIVIGARLAVNAAKSMATAHLDPIGAFNNLKSGSSQIMLDAMFTDVSGGSSSTGIKSRGGRFRGAADDKAAADAARNAERARIEWQRAAEKAREEWDKFYESMRKGGRGALDDIAKFQKAAIKDMAQENADKALLKLEEQKRKQEEAFRQNQEMVRGLSSLAGAFDQAGSAAGGAFGTILGLGGAAIQIFANLNDKALKAASTTQKLAGAVSAAASIMSGPGGAKGALGGAAQGAMAGAAFGGVGAIIGGVAGGILGLFGGKSEKAKEEDRQKEIKDTIGKLTELMDKAKALKMDMLTKSVSGLAAMFGHLSTMTDASGSRLERLGRFGGEIFNQLRKEGLSAVDAFKVMGPALDKALEAIEKNGGKMSGMFANLLDFRSKVQANESLVGAVEGFNDLITNMPLNQDSIRDVQDEMGALFDEMIGKGFTADQALSLMAPTLLRIRDAAREGRIAIDEQTQAMITEADQKGLFEGLVDPMDELVEVQKMMLELWAAIAHMQGVTLPASLQEYINTLHRAQNAQGGLSTPGSPNAPIAPGGARRDFPEHEGEPGHAASGLHQIMGRGPLSGGGTPLVAHPGEEVYIGPRTGRPRGPMGGVGPIVLTVDGKVWAEHNTQNLRRNRFGSQSQARRHLGR